MKIKKASVLMEVKSVTKRSSRTLLQSRKARTNKPPKGQVREKGRLQREGDYLLLE